MSTIQRLAGLVFLATALNVAAAGAATLTIEVAGVANDTGRIAVAVCDAEHFLKPCALGTYVPAARGTVTAVFSDVKAGRYAAQAFHDENGNGKLDSNALGIPTEGFAFSNNAKGVMGPPRFSDAAFELGDGDQKIRLRLAY